MSSADISIFSPKSSNFFILRNTDIVFYCIISNFLTFFWLLKSSSDKHGCNLLFSTKSVILGLLITMFLRQTSAYDVTNKNLSRKLNYIVGVVAWSKFGNFSIFMSEVTTTTNLKGLGQKNQLFEAYSWFKFDNFGLAIGMAWKIYTSITKG